jgi:apolipoprotein N-acyltransferase
VTLVLASLSGALCALSFPKFGQPAFAWIALAPLIVAVALNARPGASLMRHPFTLGLIAGAIYFGGTLYWIGGVMAVYGGLRPWVSGLLTALLAAYLALYPALFALLVARAVRTFGVPGVWLAPCFWVAIEWVRGSIGSGFPWVPLGASQATVLPVVQVASIAGVYGLSALVALVSAAAAAVTLSRRRVHVRGLAAVAALVVVVAVSGSMRVAGGALVERGEVMRIGLLQGNVPQDAKWDQAFREPILKRYVDLSRQAIGAGAAIVIWPETSLPFFFESEPALAAPVRRLAVESRTAFVIGTNLMEGGANGAPSRISNAAVLVGPDGRSRAVYRKMRLVPFGEYVPFKSLLFFVDRLVEAVSDFTPGTEAVVFDLDGRRFSVAICYESTFPWIARAFVAGGSQLLVTITNDAWFGRSSAAYQHFDLGAIRAVEQGRYVVRAANTGISGAVDPYGRVVARTPLFESAAIAVDVRLLDARTVYSRAGDVVVWLSLAVAIGALFFRSRDIVSPAV